MLAAQQKYQSALDGRYLSQTNLAGINYMRTDSMVGTPWSSNRFSIALNNWRGSNYYLPVANPSSTTFRNIALTSIGARGLAIGVSTLEWEGQPHYNGHPVDKRIGHWVVGYAYKIDSVWDNVWFYDPAFTQYSTTRYYFGSRINDFVGYMQNNHGVVW